MQQCIVEQGLDVMPFPVLARLYSSLQNRKPSFVETPARRLAMQRRVKRILKQS